MSTSTSERRAQETQQPCPICATLLPTSPRYPKYLCSDCSERAVDGKGRALTFYNSSMSGGFKAAFTDDGKPAEEVTKSHIAFVDGKKVWADEARFGGIVLQICDEGDGKLEA